MFKKIIVVWLSALMAVSACEYTEPVPIQYFRAAPHILAVNNKSVTPTIVNIPVTGYTVGSSLSTGNDADFDGVYTPLSIISDYIEFDGYVLLDPGVVLKHETKDYYIVGNIITTDATGQDVAQVHLYMAYPYEEWVDTNDHSQGKISHPAVGYTPGPAFAEPGIWYSTWFNQGTPIDVPFPILPYKIDTPVSGPITVFTDFTPFSAVPPAERPDYIALQYRTTDSGDTTTFPWITIKEINNPRWDTLLTYNLPVFGKNITVPEVSQENKIYLRIYAATGFIEMAEQRPVTLTISTNRRPTW